MYVHMYIEKKKTDAQGTLPKLESNLHTYIGP